MSKLQVRNSILLFLAAVIWGCAFVAQSVGMEYIEPFTFSTLRSFIGSVVLLPCIWFFGKQKNTRASRQKEDKTVLLKCGLLCGILLFTAVNLQQIAILHTSVGKSGFLTALYIVIVPVIGIFIGKRPAKKLIIAVLCAVIGMYLLCMKTGSLTPESADILLLLCAVAFALHIMTVDHFSEQVDGVKLSCIQFFICGVLSAILMLCLETPSFSAICAAWAPVLYTGVLSTGVAYTLQIVGQKGLNPVVASLLMSLESVVSALAGWLLLGQVLTGRELLGCAVMFAAIILAQLPE